MKSKLTIAFLALLIGCDGGITAPGGDLAVPTLQIVDGAHNAGNEHFFFLRPIVSRPSKNGTFDPTSSPTIEICEWSGSACVGPTISRFTRNREPGTGAIHVNVRHEKYWALWRTRRLHLDPEKIYRIRVLVDATEVGVADVNFVTSFREFHHVDRSEFVAWPLGFPLPIKFRIEEGLVTDPCAVVSFADAALESTVRQLLGNPSGPISGGDVQAITNLDIRSKGVTSLQGLECFTALKFLSASANDISDMGPIAELTGLTGLTFRENQVSDLTPLSNLTNLTVIDIARNPITDLGPLAPLTNMTAITAFNNPGITDLTPLAGMTGMLNLDFRGSPIGGTEGALAGMTQLVGLNLVSGGVSDLSFMSGMTQLAGTLLGGNRITDLSPLAALPALKLLWIDNNPLTDLTPLATMTGLTSINLFDNPGITDISPLGSLTNLTFLWMRQVQVGSQAGLLQNLTKMENLRIDTGGLADLQFVAGMSNLASLSVVSNSISDATPLLGLANIEGLSINDNPITCADPVLVQLTANGVNVICTP